MTRTRITKAERLQLIRLLVLAKTYDEKMTDIHNAVRDITGESDECGHSSDSVYSDHNADKLLRKLGITVTT